MCLTHIAPETFSVRPKCELLARTRTAWPVFVIESLLFHIYTIYAIKGQLSSWVPGPTREGRVSTRRQELYQGSHLSNDVLTGGWLDLASVLTSVKEKQHVEQMDWYLSAS